MFNTILYDVTDSVCTITLNRPDRFNAFNSDLSAEFVEALSMTRDDSDVRAVVLTGAGKAFCSGQDLKDQTRNTKDLGESAEQRYNPMIRLVTGIEKPFICRLNGVAAGAGASLVLACDYVVASEDAAMLWAFANIGLVLDSGSSFFLPRLVGRQKAFELATLGEKISAQQAFDLGLVNEVVNSGDLDASVQKIVSRYAAAPTRSIGLIKQMLNQSFSSTLDEMLDKERDNQQLAGKTKDYKEGAAAFVEKRAPRFIGG